MSRRWICTTSCDGLAVAGMGLIYCTVAHAIFWILDSQACVFGVGRILHVRMAFGILPSEYSVSMVLRSMMSLVTGRGPVVYL